MRPSIFTATRRFTLTAVGIGYKLCTVADSQYRIFTTDFVYIYLKRTFVIYGKWTTWKNNSFYTRISLRKFVVRHNFTIYIQLANTATDKLRGLWAEIKNNNLFLHRNRGVSNLEHKDTNLFRAESKIWQNLFRAKNKIRQYTENGKHLHLLSFKKLKDLLDL